MVLWRDNSTIIVNGRLVTIIFNLFVGYNNDFLLKSNTYNIEKQLPV